MPFDHIRLAKLDFYLDHGLIDFFQDLNISFIFEDRLTLGWNWAHCVGI